MVDKKKKPEKNIKDDQAEVTAAEGVEPEEGETEEEGPDEKKEASQEAIVVALGSGRNDEGKVIEFEVKVGDRVIVSKYGGTEIKQDKDTLVLLRQDDILAIVG